LTGDNFGSRPATSPWRQYPYIRYGQWNSAFPNISDANIITWAAQQIVLIIPEGQGAQNFFNMTNMWGNSRGSAADQVFFKYNNPAITQVQPTLANTDGSTNLTIIGTSFGVSGATVYVGNNVCPTIPGTQTHTSIQCRAPSGAGTNIPVSIIVGGQSSCVVNGLCNNGVFNFNPPGTPAHSFLFVSVLSSVASCCPFYEFQPSDFALVRSCYLGLAPSCCSRHDHNDHWYQLCHPG